MHDFQAYMHVFLQFLISLCWTLAIPASNIGRWSFLHPTLSVGWILFLSTDLVFAVAFRILLPPTHALTPMHAVGPLFPILRLASPAFPWFSRLGLVSLLHVVHLQCVVFYLTFDFPFACRALASRGFTWRFIFSFALHLGQWYLLSVVLTNQGSLDSEHRQRCWAHRLHV